MEIQAPCIIELVVKTFCVWMLCFYHLLWMVSCRNVFCVWFIWTKAQLFVITSPETIRAWSDISHYNELWININGYMETLGNIFVVVSIVLLVVLQMWSHFCQVFIVQIQDSNTHFYWIILDYLGEQTWFEQNSDPKSLTLYVNTFIYWLISRQTVIHLVKNLSLYR